MIRLGVLELLFGFAALQGCDQRAKKRATHFFTYGQIYLFILKNHYKSYGIYFALVLNTQECNKTVSLCLQWSLSALLMLFRLFNSSSALVFTGSTRFFGRPSITPLLWDGVLGLGFSFQGFECHKATDFNSSSGKLFLGTYQSLPSDRRPKIEWIKICVFLATVFSLL